LPNGYDGGELIRWHHALHRHAAQFGDRNIIAGQQLFHGGRPDAHAEYRGAVAQSEEDGAGVGAELQRLGDRQQPARADGLLNHHQGVAMQHIGAAVALAFQGEQFFVTESQMRRTIELVRDEGRMVQREQVICHGINRARSCGEVH
jgi:hypothetical protein